MCHRLARLHMRSEPKLQARVQARRWKQWAARPSSTHAGELCLDALALPCACIQHRWNQARQMLCVVGRDVRWTIRHRVVECGGSWTNVCDVCGVYLGAQGSGRTFQITLTSCVFRKTRNTTEEARYVPGERRRVIPGIGPSQPAPERKPEDHQPDADPGHDGPELNWREGKSGR